VSQLGQIIGRWHPQVLQEPHDLAAVDLQPLQQAHRRRASASAGWAWRHRVGGAAAGQDAVVAVGETRQERWRQPVGAGVAGERGLAAGDGEPLAKLASPALPLKLGNPLQLAAQVRRAQRMGGPW
jgi:hypothetical protein